MSWSREESHQIVEQFWRNVVVRCPDDNGPLKLKLHTLQGGDYELHASAGSVANAMNSGAATIRSGGVFATGRLRKSSAWNVRPGNWARRLARSATRLCRDIPCPVLRSFGVFVAGTPISGGSLAAQLSVRERPMPQSSSLVHSPEAITSA